MDLKRAAWRWMPGIIAMAVGVAGWWYNWHLAETEGHFYIKLCLLGPLGVFGGLLMFVRPEYAGPWRSDAPVAQKASVIGVMAAMVAFSGVDFYRLKTYERPGRGIVKNRPPQRVALTPVSITQATAVQFLSQRYRLGSYQQKHQPMWEFVREPETVDNWSTLLTIVERPDAHTRPELDRLSEGLMSTYQSNNGRILLAKTMQDETGQPFNYMVAAFEQPKEQRLELNFVRMSLTQRGSAAVVVYGVRISDREKAKQFLDQNSSGIGRALSTLELPDLAKLPRRVF